MRESVLDIASAVLCRVAGMAVFNADLAHQDLQFRTMARVWCPQNKKRSCKERLMECIKPNLGANGSVSAKQNSLPAGCTNMSLAHRCGERSLSTDTAAATRAGCQAASRARRPPGAQSGPRRLSAGVALRPWRRFTQVPSNRQKSARPESSARPAQHSRGWCDHPHALTCSFPSPHARSWPEQAWRWQCHRSVWINFLPSSEKSHH